jgi:hypothetical protein
LPPDKKRKTGDRNYYGLLLICVNVLVGPAFPWGRRFLFSAAVQKRVVSVALCGTGFESKGMERILIDHNEIQCPSAYFGPFPFALREQAVNRYEPVRP